MTTSGTYDALNKAWKSTCKVLFNSELGELEDYHDYLSDSPYMFKEARSTVSGKKVILSSRRYADGSKVLSQDEISYDKPEKLSINDIKDLDSLLDAVSDRFRYAGNKTFGNSKFIEDGDNCTDSFYVYRSATVIESKYVAYSSMVRSNSEYIFGSGPLFSSSHLLKVEGAEGLSRAFNSGMITHSSDIFSSFNCRDCNNIMFSFNLRSKRNCIGNLELPKEKYAGLKTKLVGEIRDYIIKNKTFPFIGMVNGLPDTERLKTANVKKIEIPKTDIAPVEKTFSETASLVFGKPLSPIDKYAPYLSNGMEKVEETTSAFGNKLHYSNLWSNWGIQKGRMVSCFEAYDVAGVKLTEEEASVPLDQLMKNLEKVALYAVDMFEGDSRNNRGVPIQYYATDCYNTCDSTFSKRCAYCNFIKDCDSVFGSLIYDQGCSFSMRVHNCVNVTSSLEMDGCKNCHRSMFCHNCEGLSDCLFCFNTKNKSYAIGNVEVGRESYMKIKKLVVDELLGRLEKKGTFGLDIFSMGASKNKK
ncbi:MAG: hypothetical protein ACP5NX_00375 [Candidatus Bilamarchaeaceae archaeon]